MNILIKEASLYCTVSEIVLYRNLPTVIALSIFYKCKGHDLRTPFLFAQWRRATIGNCSAALQIFTLSTALPLALATTLIYTYPLFLTAITVFWNKTKLEKPLLICLLSGFIGILVILRPTGLVSSNLLGSISGLAAGFSAAIAYMNINFLSKRGEPGWRTVLYFSAFGSVYSFIAVIVLNHGFHSQTFSHLVVLLGVGLCGLMGQSAITQAYSQGQPSITGVFSYSALLFSLGWGWLFFKDRIDILSIVGACIVALSGIFVTKIKATAR